MIAMVMPWIQRHCHSLVLLFSRCLMRRSILSSIP
nr:MAG TPA: hypothetical protein [Caudoviricetes sp.]